MAEGLELYHVCLDKNKNVYYYTSKWEAELDSEENIFIAQRISYKQAQKLTSIFSKMDFTPVTL